MQEYILITDVSLNTYSIFRAKKKAKKQKKQKASSFDFRI